MLRVRDRVTSGDVYCSEYRECLRRIDSGRMRGKNQVSEATRVVAEFAGKLSKVVVGALLLCCSGCLHHRIAIEGGFRVEENGGAPMLVPTEMRSSDSGKFQNSELMLVGGSAGAKGQADDRCVINGEVFSLRAATPMDSRHWVVRSPSVSGWNAVASHTDMDSQWKSFTRGIARMNEEGCFPAGLSSLQIRAAVAREIPLPADEVPLFFYSDQRTGLADLAPGMEVRLERFLPAAKSTGMRSQALPGEWMASYEVITRGDGVGLKLARKVQRGRGGESDAEGKELLSLAQRFARTPVLRLFLEGVYGKGQVSHGILVGAGNQQQVDAATDFIQRSDPAKCGNYEGTVCTEFPLGAVSLFSTVWINGRRTACLFGESLEGCLRSLPRAERTMRLEGAQVFRRVAPGHYAQIQLPHGKDDAARLRLLPGDRIELGH